MISSIKERMVKSESHLSLFATKSVDAIYFEPTNPNEIRSHFFHDIDQILYSLSYVRYIDKTQVYSFEANDHITKRMIHVQLVSKIARTIGRALSLNEDLIEAIALGHDLGHVPFGHPGEAILNELSLKYEGCYFMHNVQSVRTLLTLENHGKGKNISVQVLDGILCHNGEWIQAKYEPIPKTKASFLADYEACYHDIEHASTLHPMTLEGCIVRISDIIGYVGRDIEDAVRLGKLKKEEIPISITSVIGSDNRTIINTVVLDIIENSLDKPYITMSKEVYDALLALKKFNYKNIYQKAHSEEELKHYKVMFETLFKGYINDLEHQVLESSIYKVFLNDMDKHYLENTSKERMVIDYIAGMTDDYFMKEYEWYVRHQ